MERRVNMEHRLVHMVLQARGVGTSTEITEADAIVAVSDFLDIETVKRAVRDWRSSCTDDRFVDALIAHGKGA